MLANDLAVSRVVLRHSNCCCCCLLPDRSGPGLGPLPGLLPGQVRGRAGPGWLLLTCAHVCAYMHMHAHTRETAGEELFIERVVRKNYSSPAQSPQRHHVRHRDPFCWQHRGSVERRGKEA